MHMYVYVYMYTYEYRDVVVEVIGDHHLLLNIRELLAPTQGTTRSPFPARIGTIFRPYPVSRMVISSSALSNCSIFWIPASAPPRSKPSAYRGDSMGDRPLWAGNSSANASASARGQQGAAAAGQKARKCWAAQSPRQHFWRRFFTLGGFESHS